MEATVVLVHGPGGSPAAWSRVTPLLADAGVPTVVVHLPSSRPDSVLDDAAYLRVMLDDCGGPVVLVGHSAGGFTITAVGDHASVAHLVYLDGILPEVDETLVEVLPAADVATGLASLWRWEDGVTSVDPDALHSYLAERGWSSDDAHEFASGFRPSRHSAMVHAVSGATWRTVPNTLICCRDSGMSKRVHAELSGRAAGVVELPGDHFPMWSHPDEVTHILIGIARAVGG